MSYTDIPISLTLFEDSDPLTCALCQYILLSFIHLETAPDTAGLCGFAQLTKSSFTSGFTNVF